MYTPTPPIIVFEEFALKTDNINFYQFEIFAIKDAEKQRKWYENMSYFSS